MVAGGWLPALGGSGACLLRQEALPPQHLDERTARPLTLWQTPEPAFNSAALGTDAGAGSMPESRRALAAISAAVLYFRSVPAMIASGGPGTILTLKSGSLARNSSELVRPDAARLELGT